MEKFEERSNIKRYIENNTDDTLFKLKGERYKEYRRLFNEARINKVKTEKPLEITLGLTSYCNLLCKMCFRNYLSSSEKINMPMEIVDRIVSQCKELNVSSIWLGSFSEALLHPEIKTIIKKFGELEPLDFWLTTNGTLLSRDISEVLVDSGVTKLHVSLDAAKEETYKIIRGGKLDIVEKNVEEFLKIREEKGSKLPLLRVTFVEQEDNKQEIDEFVEKWSGVADIIDVQKMTDYSKLYDDMEVDSHKDSFFDCYYAFYQLAILYDGQILPCPCPIFDSGKKYNIQSTSLIEYWNCDEMKKIENSMLTGESYFDCCRKCLSLKKTEGND